MSLAFLASKDVDFKRNAMHNNNDITVKGGMNAFLLRTGMPISRVNIRIVSWQFVNKIECNIHEGIQSGYVTPINKYFYSDL